MNFAVLWLFAKVFSRNFRGVAFFGVAKASNPQKFSLRKLDFLPIRESFLPRKFPAIRYVLIPVQKNSHGLAIFFSVSDV